MTASGYVTEERTNSPTPPGRSGLAAKLGSLLKRNKELLSNAGSLVATTGLTSVFGFVFWIYAARKFSQTEVGYASAAVNSMTLLGTIGMFGMGTVLIGELPKRNSRGGLIAAALTASVLGSLMLGLGFAFFVGAFGHKFPEISGTLPRAGLFIFGVAVTGGSLVFDEATIGLMRGGLQLWRNLAMSGLKMVALPVSAIFIHDEFGSGLLLSWVIGTVLSLIPVVIMIRRMGSTPFHRPDWGVLRGLGKVALAHNWLNLALAVPPQLIPVLVTVVVSPRANAAFYVAFMLVNFLFMLPGHLSTVLFAIASAAPELIAEKLRFILRLSLIIGLPVMAGLVVGAHYVLNIFGHDYAQLASFPLLMLALGYVPGLPKAQYIAVKRATGEVVQGAIIVSIMAFAQLASVVIGGRIDGLTGLSIGLFATSFVEGALTAPLVFRAASGRIAISRDQVGSTDVLSSVTMPIPATLRATAPLQLNYQRRQEAGLSALIALATRAPEGHALDAATEIWRTGLTGQFPTLNAEILRGQRPMAMATSAQPVPPTYKQRQEAGLAALIDIAKHTRTPGVPPDDEDPNRPPRRR